LQHYCVTDKCQLTSYTSFSHERQDY